MGQVVLETSKKHSLGQRAFFMFLLRRIKGSFFFFIVAAIVWYGERWLPADWVLWGTYFANLFLLITLAWLVLVVVEAWLEYRYYTYTFTDEAFIMTYGYITRTEVAALYHQIQNVNILRNPWDRLIGVSQIVIFMTGAQRDSTQNKIILPAVGKRKAKLVQQELLARARGRAVGSRE